MTPTDRAGALDALGTPYREVVQPFVRGADPACRILAYPSALRDDGVGHRLVVHGYDRTLLALGVEIVACQRRRPESARRPCRHVTRELARVTCRHCLRRLR